MKALLGVIVVMIVVSLIIPFLKFTPLEPHNSPSPTPPGQIIENTPSCKAFSVKSPLPNQNITPPSVTVTVVVDNTNPKCHWTVSEAKAGTIELQDENQNTIGTGTLTTNEDWTANKPIIYEGSIPVNTIGGGRANLIITEENPSGQDNPQSIYIPLIL